LGNEEIESNGHRSKVEPIEMVDTMRSFENGSADFYPGNPNWENQQPI